MPGADTGSIKYQTREVASFAKQCKANLTKFDTDMQCGSLEVLILLFDGILFVITHMCDM